MKRDYLPIETLSAWIRLNGISIDDIAFQRLRTEDGIDKGSAIVATEDKSNGDPHSEGPHSEILLSVPSDVILSLELVHHHAKSDHYLQEVLDAVGDFGRTARGAILIFLVLQITYSSPDFAEKHQKIGLSNPWTEYIKFMPSSIPLPTFYTTEEQQLLRGTSLQSAVDAKMTSLETEFEHLRESTDSISWCQKYWWDEKTGKFTIDDWRYVDAVYRSRVVDLPRSGHAIVPCVDMANHSLQDSAKALYDEDIYGNAVLQLRRDKELHIGDEVTISYGDDKPAAEMVFSYGFLEKEKTDAKQIFLNLDIPNDDPLKMAKKMFCKDAPGVRLFSTTALENGHTTWDSPFVWWACVNEEDGLDFTVLQATDGGKELRASWKGKDMDDPNTLKNLLAEDPLWDIFQLRAVVLILERLEVQLFVLRETERLVSDISNDKDMSALFRPDVFSTISKLQKLEAELLEKSLKDLVERRQELITSETVTAYLNPKAEDIEEDFS